MLTLGLGLCFLLSLAGAITGLEEAREQINFAVRVMAVLLLSVVALGTLLRAAASLGREREQKTLDMLLTLPDGRKGVLEAKWLGSVLSGRWLLLGVLVALGMGMLAGGVHPLGVLLLAIVAGIHLIFIASLGLYLSVVVPGAGRAAVIGVITLVAACLAPLVYCPGGYGCILPVAWVACLPRTFDTTSWLEQPNMVISLAASLVAYAAIGGLLRFLAQSRFLREAEGVGVTG